MDKRLLGQSCMAHGPHSNRPTKQEDQQVSPGNGRVDYSKTFGREGQGSCRNTTGTIFDLHGPPGGSFMHICNDPQIGTVENAASVPICSSQPT